MSAPVLEITNIPDRFYRPSRWEAQSDAVNMIFSVKTQANPESSVGLMSMGGKGPEVLVTLTTDFGKILDGMHRTKIRGGTHLATGIQIAGVCQNQDTTSTGLLLSLRTANIACSKTSTKQIPTTAHYRLHLLPNRRRREKPCQARQAYEEEQHIDRLYCIR